MGTDSDGAALYAAAMSLSQQAFTGRHYAVAFHGLEAAMHAAYDLGDQTRLVEVGKAAREQGSWLNEHDPEHELSAYSAARRGTRSLWESLEREVLTRQQMLQGRDLLQQPHL